MSNKKIASYIAAIGIGIGILAFITLNYFTPAEAGRGDLVHTVSSKNFDDTVTDLQDAIRNAGFGIPLVLDHQENAANVGKSLRPTTLIVFGNPNVGTILMQENQTVGIDLPQKFLVWEDATGIVHITHSEPRLLHKRHKLEAEMDVLGNISQALRNLAGQGAE